MEKIQAGKYVELVYEIFVVNEEGQVSVFKFNKEHPDAFVFGMDLSLIEGFQNHIMGLEQGEKFDFTLKPEEAFGVKNPELVYELEKEIFHIDGKFAGETVRYSGYVQLVRDATPDELNPKHHGCGCGCEDCGDGCGHDHGDGCDCGCGGC